jgi:hypothetical protein
MASARSTRRAGIRDVPEIGHRSLRVNDDKYDLIFFGSFLMNDQAFSNSHF